MRLARSHADRRRRMDAWRLGRVAVVFAAELLRVTPFDKADVDTVLHQAVVKIFAAQMRVAVGGDDLEEALLDCQQRHIESAAAQVEDEHMPAAASLSLSRP